MNMQLFPHTFQLQHDLLKVGEIVDGSVAESLTRYDTALNHLAYLTLDTASRANVDAPMVGTSPAEAEAVALKELQYVRGVIANAHAARTQRSKYA